MNRLFHRRTAADGASARRGLSLHLSILLASCVALCACDLSDGDGISLDIETPEPFATFSNQDDVDSATEGSQIAVQVSTVGLSSGTVVELYRLRAGMPEGMIALASIQDSQAFFDSFTLVPGINQLQARVQSSERVSAPVSVSFDNRCGSIQFVEPARIAKDPIRLGPIDDRDDETCGDTFTTRVVASTGLSDGTEVALLVNGVASRNTATAGGVATFDDVVLGNRGATPNQIALQVTGSSCPLVKLDADVFVDCLGPNCVLGGPTTTELSAAQDKDPNSAGLQLDFEVQSDADGQDVRLLINGDVDNARTAATKKGAASFSSVSLPEGKGVRVKAICNGENGGTNASERLFNVDTSACSVAILKPYASQIFLAQQTSAEALPVASTSIDVAAAVGSDCVSFRAMASATPDCAGIAAVSATTLKAGQTTIDTEVILESQGVQHVCVQVADSAGNSASASVRVSFDNQAPNLTITNPAAALSINRAGNQGRVADANPMTPACDQPLSIGCSANGTQVQILTQPEGVILGTALCTAGRADFPSVALPTKNDGSAYTIIARSTGVNGLTGSSEPRAILADCQAQTLAFSNVSCGVTNFRSSDDADLALPGVQVALLLENNPAPRPVAALSIDGSAIAPGNLTDPQEGVLYFQNVTLALNTTPVLKACASDAAGNLGCTEDCSVNVGDVPSVTITAPSDDVVLTRDLSSAGVAYLNGAPSSHDCDLSTPGLQIEVKASVSAAEAVSGRPARIILLSGAASDAIEIASLTTNVVGNEVVGCINTADGDELTLRVEVEHNSAAVSGVATRNVRIDGHAPSAAVSIAQIAPGCRNATLRFREVLDAPGALGAVRKLTGYERRCAYRAIVNETDWSAATRVTDAVVIETPSAPALEYQWRVATRPDHSRFCTVRGYDAAGALTPLTSSVELAAAPLTERVIKLACIPRGDACVPMAVGPVSDTDMERHGTRALAVGDVNNDGFDDVLIAGGSVSAAGTAALHLGSSTGLQAAPIARFVSSPTLNAMGQQAAGIGDFNADGYDDFALSGPFMRIVFVVFGRDTAAWPTTPVVVDNGFCATDLCIGHDLNAGTGLAAAGDFDGDGISDLALSAPSSVVSVLRGSAGFRSNAALGGTDTGTCLDARTLTTGPSSTLTCNNASVPSGFHIYTKASPYLVQALHDRLYISHRGTPDNAALWAVRRRPYTQSAGMQAIGSPSDFAHLEVIHELASPAGSLFDRALSPVGDFDGDGSIDLAAGIDQSSGRFYVYPGQANGVVAFNAGVPATQVGYVLSNEQANNANDFFGDDIGLGYHPIFGLQGDLDGDGLGDILTSSRQDGLSIGSVDVFYGAANTDLARDRSDRDYAFDNQSLDHARPDADNASTYFRRGEYIGDVDGDGHHDLAISEENFSDAGQNGRLIILGECNVPP